MINKKNLKILTYILFFLVLIVLIFIFSKYYFTDLEKTKEYILNFGIFAPLVYILIMAIAIIISPIPSFPLAVISGVIFGTLNGVIYTLIGAEIGAITAFYLARKLGRKYILKKFKNKLEFIEKIPENLLALYIFIFRLFPFFQFDIVSYGAGLTKIKLIKFATVTFFGMIPMVIVFVYFGSSIKINPINTSVITIFIISMMFLLSYHFKYRLEN
ncbi:MAG: TVP38/TMEM64 family protein [Candidatus Woesearchaeota archaeon]|jgi:uncharacterized membrane protein YdjX (TVP38/TMEM64 family)|nr:TVP38/TMEM64 family protein [Candidatus Woesearchaeota archaeon]